MGWDGVAWDGTGWDLFVISLNFMLYIILKIIFNYFEFICSLCLIYLISVTNLELWRSFFRRILTRSVLELFFLVLNSRENVV